jgi:hypothetical protein
VTGRSNKILPPWSALLHQAYDLAEAEVERLWACNVDAASIVTRSSRLLVPPRLAERPTPSAKRDPAAHQESSVRCRLEEVVRQVVRDWLAKTATDLLEVVRRLHRAGLRECRAPDYAPPRPDADPRWTYPRWT